MIKDSRADYPRLGRLISRNSFEGLGKLFSFTI